MAKKLKVGFCKQCKGKKLLHNSGLCSECNAWKKSPETNYAKWLFRRINKDIRRTGKKW